MKALIDTNVLIDALFDREPFSADANRILDMVAERKIDGYVSVQSLKDIFYICKKANDGKDPYKILEKLSLTFNIMDVTSNDSLLTLTSNFDDYEDGLLAFSSLRNNVKSIVTRNAKDFYESDIIIIDPKDIDQYLEGKTESGIAVVR